MKITVEMVMAERPCKNYPPERVAELWAGRESLAPTEIAQLEIPAGDRAWLLGRLLGRHDPTRVVARRIARDVLGDRSIPDPCRRWLDYGDESLRAAAWAAAWAAARDSAAAGASAGASAAARDAAWSAAGAAASAAAWAAAGAMEKYIGWMVEFLEGVE